VAAVCRVSLHLSFCTSVFVIPFAVFIFYGFITNIPLTMAMQESFRQFPRLWGDTLALATITTLPMLVVFLVFQRWFSRGVATAGIKG
jgi:ABC-type glycerol-3-phosphate transport system permease component